MSKLNWIGPIPLWAPAGDKCLLRTEDADCPGVYLWTVPVDDCYRVNYVGMTPGTIRGRQIEHVRKILGGEYLINDPDALKLGKTEPIHTPVKGIVSILELFESDPQKIFRLLKLYQMFYVPCSDDVTRLKRIESGLIETLRQSSTEIRDYLDNDRLSIRIYNDEKELVHQHFNVKVRGLGKELYI